MNVAVNELPRNLADVHRILEQVKWEYTQVFSNVETDSEHHFFGWFRADFDSRTDIMISDSYHMAGGKEKIRMKVRRILTGSAKVMTLLDLQIPKELVHVFIKAQHKYY